MSAVNDLRVSNHKRVIRLTGARTDGATMPEEVLPASPGPDPPPSAARGADDVQARARKDYENRKYTPVSLEASDPATPWGDDLNAGEGRIRGRKEELADLDHRLEVAKRRTRLAQEEQEAAELKARGKAKIVLLRLSVWTAIAAVLHAAAWGIWEFFHPLSDFELVLSVGTFAVSEACSCVGLYLTGRFGKGKSSTSTSASLDEAASTLFIEADKLTRLPDES